MRFFLLPLTAIAFALTTSSSPPPPPPPATTPIVYYGSPLNGSCRTNTNCQGLVFNSRCRKGKCVCRRRYVPMGKDRCIPAPSTTVFPPTTTTTIYYDSLLGDTCRSNSNCDGLVGKAICLNQKCVCRTGYAPSGRDRCILAQSTTIPSPPSTRMIYYDSLLGGTCQSNTNCDGLVGNAICLNRKCVCRSGYVPSGRDRCILS